MGYTRIIQFVKTTEVYSYEKEINKKRNYSIRRRTRGIRYRSQHSIKRARKTFFNLCKNQLDSLDELPFILTLTYHNEYEQPPTISDSYRHSNLFWKKAKSYFGNSISYISIPEYQTRGYLHYHALVWGFPKTIANERTTRILQRLWRQGFVDVLPTSYKSDALAGYLAKYFSKTFADSRFSNRKTYTSSRNINRPKTHGSNVLSTFLSTIISENTLIDIKEYNTLWLGRTIKRIYKNNYA